MSIEDYKREREGKNTGRRIASISVSNATHAKVQKLSKELHTTKSDIYIRGALAFCQAVEMIENGNANKEVLDEVVALFYKG